MVARSVKCRLDSSCQFGITLTAYELNYERDDPVDLASVEKMFIGEVEHRYSHLLRREYVVEEAS